mgnify:FL=1
MSEIYTPEIPETPDVPNMPTSSPVNGDPSKDWMAIVSLVASILALCTSFIPLLCCASPILAIGGIVLGILGLKSSKRVLAIVGLALGGVALLVQVIIMIVGIVGGTFADNYDMIYDQLDSFDY